MSRKIRLRRLKEHLGLLLPPREVVDLPREPALAAESFRHEFLLGEYTSLTTLVNARDERIDRFLAIYLALAGAPFLLYVAILKDRRLLFDLSQIPVIVTLALIFVSLAGYAVLKIVVQLRFSAILYIRAMNGIRNVYAQGAAAKYGLLLPVDPRYPAYSEGPRWRVDDKGNTERDQTKYMYEVIRMMAIANGVYLGVGIYYYPRLIGGGSPTWDHVGPVLVGAAYFAWQMYYYFRAGRARELRGRVAGRI